MRLLSLNLIIALALVGGCGKANDSDQNPPDEYAIESVQINDSKIEALNDLQTLLGSADDTAYYENASNSKIKILSYDQSGLKFYIFEDDSVKLYSVNFEVFNGEINHPKLVLNKGVRLAKIEEVFKASYENRHRYLEESSGNTKVLFTDGAGLGEVTMEFKSDSLKSFTYNIYPDKF